MNNFNIQGATLRTHHHETNANIERMAQGIHLVFDLGLVLIALAVLIGR